MKPSLRATCLAILSSLITCSVLQAATLTVSVTGQGTVTGGGLSCGNICSAYFPAGTSVSLTLTAAADSHIQTLSVTPSSSDYTLMKAYGITELPVFGGSFNGQVKMDADTTVNVVFGKGVILVTNLGSGSVSLSSGGKSCCGNCPIYPDHICRLYANDEVVTLTANAKPGAQFLGWQGECSGTGPCTLTMDRTRAVTARFTTNNYTLTITKNGTGTVTGSGGINCGTICTQTTQTYPDQENQPTTRFTMLTATASAGSLITRMEASPSSPVEILARRIGLSGPVSTITGPVRVEQDKTVTFTFSTPVANVRASQIPGTKRIQVGQASPYSVNS